MSQAPNTYRATLAELVNSPNRFWAGYVASLALFAVFSVFGRELHWSIVAFSAIWFLLAIMLGAVAIFLSLTKEYFLEPDKPNSTRFFMALGGGAVCALCYGFLETQLNPVGGVAPGELQWAAKSVASFVSGIGFAGVFAAFTVELTGGRQYPLSYTPVSYTVQAINFSKKDNNLMKELFFVNSKGKVDSLTANLHKSSGPLAESARLAATVRTGDTIKVIESRNYRFIIKVVPDKSKSTIQ